MRVLLVHPSPLMYSELYLRLEPLGLERVAAAIEAAGHEVRLLDLQIFKHADYWHEVETFAPQAVGFSVNYLANVPEVVDLAKETKARRGCPVRIRRRAQRVLHRRRVPRPRRRRHRLHRARRRRGHRAAGARGHRRSEAREPARRGHPARRGPEPDPAQGPRPAPPRAPPRPATPQVLHRRARSLRVHRVHARLPVGLLVLQRVDLLRAQLPQGLAGGGGGGPRAHPRAQRLHRGRRRLHPGRARLRDRPRDRAPAHPQAVLPGDALRRADQEPGAVRVLEAARPLLHVPRHRGPRRRGPPAPPQAGDAEREPPGARDRPVARPHRRHQHHRGPRAGTRPGSPRCATGRSPCPRSCTSRWPPPTPAPRSG